MIKKLPLIAVTGALAAAVPIVTAGSAAARPACHTHTVAYVAHGKYVSSSPTLTTGTWGPGSLTINLISANHHFKKANGVTIKHNGAVVQFTFTNVTAKVTFSSAVKKAGLKAGDRVTVTGTLSVKSGHNCTSPTVTVVIHHIYVTSKTGK